MKFLLLLAVVMLAGCSTSRVIVHCPMACEQDNSESSHAWRFPVYREWIDSPIATNGDFTIVDGEWSSTFHFDGVK